MEPFHWVLNTLLLIGYDTFTLFSINIPSLALIIRNQSINACSNLKLSSSYRHSVSCSKDDNSYQSWHQKLYQQRDNVCNYQSKFTKNTEPTLKERKIFTWRSVHPCMLCLHRISTGTVILLFITKY